MSKSGLDLVFILIISTLLLGSYGSPSTNVFVKDAPMNLDENQEHTLNKLLEPENSPVPNEEIRINMEKTLPGLIGGFLENKGQKNEAIHYYTESREMAVGFGTSEIRYSLANRVTGDQVYDVESGEGLTNDEITFIPVGLKFLGSNKVVPVAKEPTGVYSHFFIGSDRNKWSSSNYYSKIIYYDIYNQIAWFTRSIMDS